MTPKQASKIRVGNFLMGAGGRIFEVCEDDIDHVNYRPQNYILISDWLIIKHYCEYCIAPIYNTMEQLEKKYKK